MKLIECSTVGITHDGTMELDPFEKIRKVGYINNQC